MLIDSLAFTLEKSGCLDTFWGKLDAGEDATLGVAASARPFLVAARFAHAPQPRSSSWRRGRRRRAPATWPPMWGGARAALERDDYPFDRSGPIVASSPSAWRPPAQERPRVVVVRAPGRCACCRQ
ncbi:MAG: hypothetical protein ACLUVF_11255 [Adlercreutzia sp.]